MKPIFEILTRKKKKEKNFILAILKSHKENENQ